jgi:hypothetical protein
MFGSYCSLGPTYPAVGHTASALTLPACLGDGHHLAFSLRAQVQEVTSKRGPADRMEDWFGEKCFPAHRTVTP